MALQTELASEETTVARQTRSLRKNETGRTKRPVDRNSSLCTLSVSLGLHVIALWNQNKIR